MFMTERLGLQAVIEKCFVFENVGNERFFTFFASSLRPMNQTYLIYHNLYVYIHIYVYIQYIYIRIYVCIYIYTWNPKQPVLNGCLVKQPFCM